jgi:hypothetical protein
MTDPKKTASHEDSVLLNPSVDHPLAAALGQFEGEFWEDTLAEIQWQRQRDRQELELELPDDKKLTA